MEMKNELTFFYLMPILSTHERNSHVDPINGSGIQKTKFGNVFFFDLDFFFDFEQNPKKSSF